MRPLRRQPRILIGCSLLLAVLAFAFAGPLLSPYDPADFVGRPFRSPTLNHWLGTDILGRDVLSNLMSGGRLFLTEGLTATGLGVGMGVVFGVSLALLPHRTSEKWLTLSDIVIVLPQMVIALLVLTRLGPSPLTLIGVVGFVHVPQTARVIRAAALKVVTADYFHSARALGASSARLLWGEVLPNITGAIAVEAGIRLAISLVVLASLSYLGFGASDLEWGHMIHENQGGLPVQPWATLAPVVLLSLFLIGANVLRDGLARAVSERG